LKVFNKSEVRSEVWYSQKTSILILITVWSRRDLSIKLKIRLYFHCSNRCLCKWTCMDNSWGRWT